jgi:hypothetical protein
MVMMISVEFSHEYCQFSLTISITGGLGMLLVFILLIIVFSYFFYNKYSLRIIASSSSRKGIIIRLILKSLFNFK